MKTRTLIAAMIFLLLTAIKITAPQLTEDIRGFIMPVISQQTDYRNFITAVGSTISGKDNAIYASGDEMTEGFTNTASRKKPDVSEAFPISEMINQNLSSFNKAQDPNAAGTDPGDGESVNESQINNDGDDAESSGNDYDATTNPKLQEFLDEQAAFSDIAVPANVSYDIPALSFECSSPADISTTSGFGYRKHPIYNDVRFHYGVDFPLYDGNDICAFADATVISVQEISGYGLAVILDHGDGFTTLYAHCSQILVNQGDNVTRGQVIALSGHSGRVTGPHLHFELMKDGKYLNPEFYL